LIDSLYAHAGGINRFPHKFRRAGKQEIPAGFDRQRIQALSVPTLKNTGDKGMVIHFGEFRPESISDYQDGQDQGEDQGDFGLPPAERFQSLFSADSIAGIHI